jgi:transposase
MSLLALFVDVDDFCQALQAKAARQLRERAGRRVRQPGLWDSEIMTIIIHFHQAGYRDFKTYYTQYVQRYLRGEFPGLVSYTRFVRLMPRVVLLLWAYALYRCGRCTGVSFIDSTTLRVCHNRRITRHRVFAGRAARGQSSMGWFYGFKLHLVVNDQGDILAFMLTPGNVDDRQPVPRLAQRLFGKLFGDKGYVSLALLQTLLEQGVHLITNLRANMKNRLMALQDKLLLRKRFIIETINDQLKNISQIEHSRHRSPINFLVNLLGGLIAYMWQPKKPALKFSSQETRALARCA